MIKGISTYQLPQCQLVEAPGVSSSVEWGALGKEEVCGFDESAD